MNPRLFIALLSFLILLPVYSQAPVNWNKILLENIRNQEYEQASIALDKGARADYVNEYKVKNQKTTRQWPAVAILFFPVILLDAIIPAGSTHYSESAFHELLEQNDSTDAYHALVEKMISQGAEINRVSHSMSPLSIALSNRNLRLVKILREAGADPYQSIQGYYPLIFALNMETDTFSQYLLSKDPTSPGRKKKLESILLSSLKLGEMTAARKLLVMGIRPQPTPDGNNFYHYLTGAPGGSGFEKLSRDTITAWFSRFPEYGLDVNAQNAYQQTPLMQAADKYGINLDLILLARPDPDITDYKGRTALHLAAMFEKKNMVKALVQYGADIHIRDKDGKTAGEYMTATWDEEMITLLEIPIEKEKSNTIAFWQLCKNTAAYTENNRNKMLELIRDGIYPNQVMGKETVGSFDPVTFLPYAVKAKDRKIAEALLQAGASPLQKDPNSNSFPLYGVFNTYDTAMATLLIRYGADPTDAAIKRKVEFYEAYSDCSFWVDICRIRNYFENLLGSERYAWWAAQPEGGYLLVNHKNEPLLNITVDAYTPYTAEGYAMVYSGSHWGIIKKGGRLIQAPRFDTIYAIHYHTPHIYSVVGENGMTSIYKNGDKKALRNQQFDEFIMVYTPRDDDFYFVMRYREKIAFISEHGYAHSNSNLYTEVKREKQVLYGRENGKKWKKIHF